MTGRLNSKVALITGGASGIGLGIARRFVSEGASVVLGDIDINGLHSAQAELGARCAVLAGDITDEAHVMALIAHAVHSFGRIDVAVNSAGRGDYAPIVDQTVEQWRSLIELCLTGVFLSIKHEGRQMSAQRSGVIINIASLNALQPSAGMSAYCSAKAAVAMLTKVAAMELGPHGIRVNALAPGLIDTPATAVFHAVEAIRDSFRDNTTVGRTGTVDDVAAAAVFLASDEASFISAETLVVDGGGQTGRYPDLPSIFSSLAP